MFATSVRRTSAGFAGPRNALEERSLATGELDRVGTCLGERGDRALHVLDPGEEGRLSEEAVVDCDVEASAVGCEKSVEPRLHRTSLIAARADVSSSPSQPVVGAARRGREGARRVREPRSVLQGQLCELRVQEARRERVAGARSVHRLDGRRRQRGLRTLARDVAARPGRASRRPHERRAPGASVPPGPGSCSPVIPCASAMSA